MLAGLWAPEGSLLDEACPCPGLPVLVHNRPLLGRVRGVGWGCLHLRHPLSTTLLPSATGLELQGQRTLSCKVGSELKCLDTLPSSHVRLFARF